MPTKQMVAHQKGRREGVVSELSCFFKIIPGNADDHRRVLGIAQHSRSGQAWALRSTRSRITPEISPSYIHVAAAQVATLPEAHFEAPGWTSVDHAIAAGKLAGTPIDGASGCSTPRPYWQLRKGTLLPAPSPGHRLSPKEQDRSLSRLNPRRLAQVLLPSCSIL